MCLTTKKATFLIYHLQWFQFQRLTSIFTIFKTSHHFFFLPHNNSTFIQFLPSSMDFIQHSTQGRTWTYIFSGAKKFSGY
jgi:hypothetical protein